jgi:hypothetical protein
MYPHIQIPPYLPTSLPNYLPAPSVYSCAWALVTRRSGWGGLMIANADDENDRSIRVHAATKLIFAMLMMMTTMMNNQVKYDVL